MEFNYNRLVDLFIALLGLLGGAVGIKVINYIIDYKVFNMDKYIVKNMEIISEVYQQMNHLVHNNKDVDRVQILIGHDSGDIPNPIHPYYSKVLYESHSDGHALLNDRMQYGIKIDSAYINLLLKLIGNKHISFSTDGLDNGILKTLYESEKINYTEIFYLGRNKKGEIYYFAVSSKKHIESFENSTTDLNVRMCVDKIEQLLSNYLIK